MTLLEAVRNEIAKRGLNVEVGLQFVEKPNSSHTEIQFLKAGDAMVQCFMIANGQRSDIELSALHTEDEMMSYAKNLVDKYVEILKQREAVVPVNPDQLISKDYILKNVVPTLIQTSRNQEVLKDYISRPFLDLSIILRVVIGENEDLESSYTITKDIAASLEESDGLTEEDLFFAARKNLEEGKMIVRTMSEVLGLPDILLPILPPMYVLQSSAVRGASVLLRQDVLTEVAKKLDSETIAIIPSSVHEILAVPLESMDVPDIDSIIDSVNTNDVDDCDILSDHVYFFSVASGQVSMPE